jgi:hypothetical protein
MWLQIHLRHEPGSFITIEIYDDEFTDSARHDCPRRNVLLPPEK